MPAEIEILVTIREMNARKSSVDKMISSTLCAVFSYTKATAVVSEMETIV